MSERQDFILITDRVREKVCVSCGSTFVKDPRNTWKYWSRAKYCSQACAGAAWSRDAAAKHLSLREAYERHVVRGDGCWGWSGLTNRRGGYAIFPYEGKMRYAHLVSLELDGRPVPKGMYGCHHCDNPVCSRPDHLYVGTAKDNSRDAMLRGRVPAGSRHYAAKITEADVRTIRCSGASDKVLAEALGMSRSNIAVIRARKTWKHVA